MVHSGLIIEINKVNADGAALAGVLLNVHTHASRVSDSSPFPLHRSNESLMTSSSS